MTITFGGKPIQPKKSATRLGKHRQLTVEQIAKRHPADPFPPVDSFRGDTPEHRISVGCELKTWVEIKLDDLVPLADEENWLRLQLRNPEFEGHPARPAGLRDLQHLHEQIEEVASDIAYLEAHADRIWQASRASEREELGKRWIAEVDEDRLILHAWKCIAPVGFTWPDYYQVQIRWFSCLADPLKQDIRDHWPRDGIPLGKQHELDSEPGKQIIVSPGQRSNVIEVEDK